MKIQSSALRKLIPSIFPDRLLESSKNLLGASLDLLGEGDNAVVSAGGSGNNSLLRFTLVENVENVDYRTHFMATSKLFVISFGIPLIPNARKIFYSVTKEHNYTNQSFSGA